MLSENPRRAPTGRWTPLCAQFDLGPGAIRSACAEALGRHDGASEDLGELLWEAGRAQARPRLEDLAHHIEPAATWDDLVLPGAQKQLLREVAVHVRQRTTVYEGWGFAARSSRGLGISALFAGPSGTGKTMAAEVLANELRLDLYRIDLSSVVSKYIGETEKNLRRIFEAAEGGGAILLFDEADALFGKRSEVRDSHDRYANIEVSYLLQRMESLPRPGDPDDQHEKRAGYSLHASHTLRRAVPVPGCRAARRDLASHLPARHADRSGWTSSKLARLNVAGGNIRNIALNAAFLAADAEEPVRMTHLLCAARERVRQAGEAADRGRDRGMGMTPRNVELHIEELVFHGFASGERYRIGDAMKHELSRLFAEQGTPLSLAQGCEVVRLDGGAFEVKPGSRAQAIGVQVAQAVYGGFST